MKTPGPYEAIVLADSIASGVRLTTLCCTFPRIVLAEFNTHRMFSRNSASSRAIPVVGKTLDDGTYRKGRVDLVRENPYVPLSFGKNRGGMQATKELDVVDAQAAYDRWLRARDHACFDAERLADIGLHKQWANRLLEPFAWHTVIVSATEWANYFALRISEYAQPEIKKVSEAMKAAMDASVPNLLKPGDWHLPLVEASPRITLGDGARMRVTQEHDEDGRLADDATLVKLSVSRCAAISYERHMDHDVKKDLARYDKLFEAKHMSPFEHAAMVGETKDLLRFGLAVETPDERVDCWPKFIGNFRAPWIQWRKQLPGEAVWDG